MKPDFAEPRDVYPQKRPFQLSDTLADGTASGQALRLDRYAEPIALAAALVDADRITGQKRNQKVETGSSLMNNDAREGLAEAKRRIGRRLQNCRRERGLTLRALSHRTGLTIGFLSQVERGISAPSLSSLIALAKAMGVAADRFLEPPPEVRGVTRAPERPIFRVGGGPISYERISAHLDGGKINAARMRVPPGYRSERLSHDGEELMYVLDGTIRVTIEEQETELRAGDSIHFGSRQLHNIHNPTRSDCLILWTGTLSLFDSASVARREEIVSWSQSDPHRAIDPLIA